jgi:DNA-binding transcriptional MerR regulator
MLVKILLILAILAGIAAIILGITQIKPKIEGLQEKLMTETDWHKKETTRANASEKAHAKTKADLKDEVASHNDTKGKLSRANEALAEANNTIKTREARIDQLTADLTKAKQDLAAWEALGIPVNKIKEMIASLEAEKLKNEVLTDEKKMLSRRIASLEAQLAELLGKQTFDDEEGVPMSPNLQAKVVAVDPKWDIVVLDVGKNQDAREGGNMIIYRDGKLLAKVKIRTVSENNSVATIMKGWKIVDVEEGDLALHRQVRIKQ